MATSEQLKAILKSYIDRDDTQFFSIAMQIAAHEARVGHGQLAKELRTLIDAAKLKSADAELIKKAIPPEENFCLWDRRERARL